MSNVFRKLILSFLSFLIVFFSVAPYFPTLAVGACAGTCRDTACQGDEQVEAGGICTGAGQTCCAKAGVNINTEAAVWYSPGLFEFYSKVFDKNSDDIFGERYTYAQVVWILESLPFALLGVGPNTFQEILQQLQSNPTGMNVLSDPNSKLAQLKDPFLSIINQFYANPPASGTRWLTQKINNFSIVKHAYAQTGFGYTSLQMFQPLWSASRNIAYSLMVIILLAIAFAIMFRLKISPQVVVTVQSALPKIVITLILVTFSYAIAGFLIDLMYLIFGALVYGISGISNSAGAVTSLGIKPEAIWEEFLNGSILDKAWSSPFVIGSGIAAGGSIVGLIVALTVGSAIPGLGLIAAGALIPFILGLIVAAIIYFFKVFIMLAQTYLSLVINIIFGPIIILAEAIPFVEANAMGWFRTICADITVFLAVGLIFAVQTLLSDVFKDTATTIPWSPPYLGFHPIIMRLIIWIGVWSILPNIKDLVYAMFKRKSPQIQSPEFSEFGRSVSGVMERTMKGVTDFRTR